MMMELKAYGSAGGRSQYVRAFEPGTAYEAGASGHSDASAGMPVAAGRLAPIAEKTNGGPRWSVGLAARTRGCDGRRRRNHLWPMSEHEHPKQALSLVEERSAFSDFH